MIFDVGTPLPAHVLEAIPDDFAGTLYELWWQKGPIVVGIAAGDFDNLSIETPLWGVTVEQNERRAVELAVASFQVGWVQHRLAFGHDVADDEIRDALAAATMRGDLDVADLLEAATERGIGPVEPAPAVRVGGYRH